MKSVQVVFNNSDYNYTTAINPACSNESVVRYFLGQELEMHDGTLQRVIAVRFAFKVIAGSFVGQVGYMKHDAKPNPILMLHKTNGDRIAVATSQIEQIK